MSYRADVPFVLAYVIVWTFYFTPSGFSLNLENIFGLQTNRHEFNYSVATNGSESTGQNSKLESINELNSEVVVTITPNIAKNGSYKKRKYSRKKQLVFLPVEIIKLNSLSPGNSSRVLNRGRRSDPVVFSELPVPNNTISSNSTNLNLTLNTTDSDQTISNPTISNPTIPNPTLPNSAISDSTNSNSTLTNPTESDLAVSIAANSSSSNSSDSILKDLNSTNSNQSNLRSSYSNSPNISSPNLNSTLSNPSESNSIISGSTKSGSAVSKAVAYVGDALSRSYNPGSGESKAEAVVKDGGKAVAQAKALENNSSAIAISKGGGHALAAAESGRNGTAQSTSISEGNGSSKAVVTVLEGHAIATSFYESTQSDASHTNDYPSLRPAQDSSYMKIDFDDSFFRPGFKSTAKPKGINSASIQLGRTVNKTKISLSKSIDNHEDECSSPYGDQMTNLEGHSNDTEYIYYLKSSENKPQIQSVGQLRPPKNYTHFKNNCFHKVSTTLREESVKIKKYKSSEHYARDQTESDLIYINGTSKCKNIPWIQMKQYNFVKTDNCIMVFNYFNCQSFYSRKFEAGTSSTGDFVIYSYQLCNGTEGGPQLNLDITEYIIGWIEPTKVLKSYKDVCNCMNVPNAVEFMNYWSINNHGNDLMAYYEGNCTETSTEATLITGGHSYESRNIYFLKKNHRKIQSFGPAKNSTYFRNRCLTTGSI